MDPKSRGGSRHIHTQLRPGQIIEVDPPLNNFVLDESAEHTVLIAGGIGITPIFSHARKLAQLQKEFEVYQAARERSRAAYCEKLEEISPMYHLHIDDENQGQFLDIPGIVQQQTPKTHLYCCGPPAMMQSFEAAVAEIPESQVHVEYFVARSEAEQGQSGDFFLGLARSGREFLVPADRSALEVLLENGVTISNSCQEGICGSCETRVLEGTPDHRDSVLSKAEKLSNKTVMLCVSRCQGERMVVDLCPMNSPAPEQAPGRQVRLEFQNVLKQFDVRGDQAPLIAVREVSFKVYDREVVTIIGPSGCGKSTLLNLGSGLDPVTSGQVFVDSELVTRPNSHVAFMLQKDLLLPWRTIRQNVELGLEIQRSEKSQRRELALQLLDRCRLLEFQDQYPHQLSGGMRQRAALARTLAVDPSVLLMDEPFSALDAQTKMVLQQDLGQTLAEEGKTALFITHDLTEAIALSDRVLVMSQRPGTIVEEITVDLVDRENPMQRRKHPKVNEYVGILMDLLHIDQATA